MKSNFRFIKAIYLFLLILILIFKPEFYGREKLKLSFRKRKKEVEWRKEVVRRKEVLRRKEVVRRKTKKSEKRRDKKRREENRIEF